MFKLKKYSELNIELYNEIQDNLEEFLTFVSTRIYSGHIEEVYRFEDTDYHLEIFYEVPSEKRTMNGFTGTPPKFGIFNTSTCEPIPVETAFNLLPKRFRKLIFFNMDHFSKMKDIFR